MKSSSVFRFILPSSSNNNVSDSRESINKTDEGSSNDPFPHHPNNNKDDDDHNTTRSNRYRKHRQRSSSSSSSSSPSQRRRSFRKSMIQISPSSSSSSRAGNNSKKLVEDSLQEEFRQCSLSSVGSSTMSRTGSPSASSINNYQTEEDSCFVTPERMFKIIESCPLQGEKVEIGYALDSFEEGGTSAAGVVGNPIKRSFYQLPPSSFSTVDHTDTTATPVVKLSAAYSTPVPFDDNSKSDDNPYKFKSIRSEPHRHQSSFTSVSTEKCAIVGEQPSCQLKSIREVDDDTLEVSHRHQPSAFLVPQDNNNKCTADGDKFFTRPYAMKSTRTEGSSSSSSRHYHHEGGGISFRPYTAASNSNINNNTKTDHTFPSEQVDKEVYETNRRALKRRKLSGLKAVSIFRTVTGLSNRTHSSNSTHSSAFLELKDQVQNRPGACIDPSKYFSATNHQQQQQQQVFFSTASVAPDINHIVLDASNATARNTMTKQDPSMHAVALHKRGLKWSNY